MYRKFIQAESIYNNPTENPVQQKGKKRSEITRQSEDLNIIFITERHIIVAIIAYLEL